VSRSFRYSFILILFALGTGLAAVAGWRYARTSSPVSGPIVLVSVDALRADHLPAYGYSHVATPAIDALARDGIVFERAYAHSPQTLPAHAALLSGRLPFDVGVRDDVGFVVPPSTRLLSHMLAARGYATGGIVSSFALRRSTGLANGFSFYDDELEREPDASAPRGLPRPPAPRVPIVRREGAESELRAERWLSGAGTSRAFLFLQLDEPHAPYAPPARFGQLAPYDAEIAYADELVGRLVNYLKKQQLYDQATIILVGDHGESLGAHGEDEHGLFVYDDTVRVPLIVKQAAAEGAGRRVRSLVQHADIVPTVLDLAKAPIPDDLEGRSLRPLLEGGEMSNRIAYAESYFGFYQFGWNPLTTVTDGRYRYVGGSAPALYDLDADPAALHDIAAARPEEAARLADELKSFEERASARTEIVRSRVAPADRDRLLALGSLGPRGGTSEAALAVGSVDEAVQVQVAQTYRMAMSALANRRWSDAIDRLRGLAREHPAMRDLWMAVGSVASRAGRHEVAADAYRRILASDAMDADAHLSLAWALVRARRLDEAAQHAQLAAESAAEAPLRTAAYEVLARIAVTRQNPGGARVQAQHARQLDPDSPVPAFIEGRLLLDRGRYDEALSLLDEAAASTRAADVPLVDLQFWRGEALVKLDRPAEAEDAYLTELSEFPESTRTHVALATLYHAQERHDEAAEAIARMTAEVATPDALEAAARLWTSFGDRERAQASRAESRRLLTAPQTTATSHQ
jgi:tetratricopeptide (TPR) repeat protein